MGYGGAAHRDVPGISYATTCACSRRVVSPIAIDRAVENGEFIMIIDSPAGGGEVIEDFAIRQDEGVIVKNAASGTGADSGIHICFGFTDGAVAHHTLSEG